MVAALVRGVEKHGGRVLLRSHVEEVVVEGGKAVGVRLRGGRIIRARHAVVSNASSPDTLRLLPPAAVPADWRAAVDATPLNNSFMHLHLGCASWLCPLQQLWLLAGPLQIARAPLPLPPPLSPPAALPRCRLCVSPPCRRRFDATGLEGLGLHHIVVDSWDRPGGVCAEQNVVLISIASGGLGCSRDAGWMAG